MSTTRARAPPALTIDSGVVAETTPLNHYFKEEKRVRGDGQRAGSEPTRTEGDEQAGSRRRGWRLRRDGQEGRARGPGDVPYRARCGRCVGCEAVPDPRACARPRV